MNNSIFLKLTINATGINILNNMLWHMQGDVTEIDNLSKELKQIKTFANGEANKAGLTWKDVTLKISSNREDTKEKPKGSNEDTQKLVNRYKGTDFELPEGICEEGTKAWQQIMQYLEKTYKDREPDAGGCRAFYSSKEWIDRGEQYGTESLLIVVHDGGDQAPMLNISYQRYELYDGLNKALTETYTEACTCWYAAVYKA